MTRGQLSDSSVAFCLLGLTLGNLIISFGTIKRQHRSQRYGGEKSRNRRSTFDGAASLQAD
jgi:hypothetical protein